MLKKGFSLFMVFVFIMMALCACQTKDAQDPPEETSNPVTTPDTSNPPSDDMVAFPDWKIAYLDFIETREREYGKESAYEFDFRYALVYVDNDDIPELYAMGMCEADGDLICSYKNGRITEQCLERRHGGKYLERGGILINKNGTMGEYFDNVYQLDQTGFSRILNASWTERYLPLENGDYEIINKYFIDGEAVSKDAYTDAVNHAVDLSQTLDFYENAVPYDVIKQQIADCN